MTCARTKKTLHAVSVCEPSLNIVASSDERTLPDGTLDPQFSASNLINNGGCEDDASGYFLPSDDDVGIVEFGFGCNVHIKEVRLKNPTIDPE